MKETQYTILPPVGNVIVPKSIMTEREIRQFALQITQESYLHEVWKEKIEKDDIKDVIDWMGQLGYIVLEK